MHRPHLSGGTYVYDGGMLSALTCTGAHAAELAAWIVVLQNAQLCGVLAEQNAGQQALHAYVLVGAAILRGQR